MKFTNILIFHGILPLRLTVLSNIFGKCFIVQQVVLNKYLTIVKISLLSSSLMSFVFCMFAILLQFG